MRLRPKLKENPKIELIRKYRHQKKTIMEIADILNITKQGVDWYVQKYKLDEGLDKPIGSDKMKYESKKEA